MIDGKKLFGVFDNDVFCSIKRLYTINILNFQFTVLSNLNIMSIIDVTLLIEPSARPDLA